MFLKKITAFTLITGALIAGSANAQKTEKYLTVGMDKAGYPILLETQEIQGTSFKLMARYGSGLFETTFHASCGESRLFMTKIVNYSESGQALDENVISEEIPFNAKSPGGIGMTYVCRKVGAIGW